MNLKKGILFITLCLLIQAINSQEIELTENITFKIRKIKYKKTTRGGTGWVFSPKGYKYIIIDTDFYGKSGKREKLPLFEMRFETANEKYKVRPFSDVSPEYVKGFYFKIKKKKNRNLYIVVDDDFENGILYFKNKKILKISVEKDSKEGKYEVLNK